jgi:hypothetical protein
VDTPFNVHLEPRFTADVDITMHTDAGALDLMAL